MFDQGQSFFCAFKVQDWLRERQHDPNDYEIIFHQKPAPPAMGLKMMVEIELRRRDGQPVSPELLVVCQAKDCEFEGKWRGYSLPQQIS
jgi:hypothetical protein